jgi:hypothetical protein
MTVTSEPPPAVTAGVSPAELKVMRAAAARLTGTGDTPGAGDPFGVLAAPFRPAPADGRASYNRVRGHLWCT